LLTKATFFYIMFHASNPQYPVFAPIKVESVGKYIWLLPCPKETPFFATGNHRINSRIFVESILSRPDLTSNGKFVLDKVDIFSAMDYTKPWGKVIGNEAEVVETSIEDLDKNFPTWSREVGTTLEYWNWARDKAWSVERQRRIATKDLGGLSEGKLDCCRDL
jgi:hypothetical protein